MRCTNSCLLIRPLCADGLRTLFAASSSLDGIGRAVDRDVGGWAKLRISGTLLSSKDGSCSAMLSKWGNARPASGHITSRFLSNVECSASWLVTLPTSFLGQSCALLLDIGVMMSTSCAKMVLPGVTSSSRCPLAASICFPLADCCVLIARKSVLSTVKAGRQQAIS